MNELDEKKNKVKITHGMANMQKHAARKCPKCGLGIGTYPGRYPNHCPDCGTCLKPTVEEQFALVQRGVPASDVAWMVTDGVDLGYVAECIDGGEPLEEIIGKFKQAFQKGLAGVKKGAGEIKQQSKEKKKRKVKATGQKLKKLGAQAKKATGAKKKRIQQKRKKLGKQRAKLIKKTGVGPQKKALVTKGAQQRSAVGKERIAAQKKAEAEKKKREKERKAKQKPKPKKKPAPRKPASRKPKPQKKPTQQQQQKRESVMKESVNWKKTPMGPQVDAIRYSIGKQISEQGYATLGKLQEKFKSNPVALRNLVTEHQEPWNIILTERGGKIYPRKQGDQITG
jgi:hypothetical protein